MPHPTGCAASLRRFDEIRRDGRDRPAGGAPSGAPGRSLDPALRLSTRLRSAPARRFAALAVATLLGGVAAAASRAQEAPVPACAAATAGQLSSQAGVRCACRFFPASGLAAMPAGHRWDCGLLRARLADDLVDLNPYPYPLPDALSLERVIVPEALPDWPRPRR